MGKLIHAILLSLAPTLPGILNCRLSTRTYCVDSLSEKGEVCKNACQSNTFVWFFKLALLYAKSGCK